MSEAEKERVKRVIYEMSKDSEHYKEEQRKQKQAEARIEEARAKVSKLSASELLLQQEGNKNPLQT